MDMIPTKRELEKLRAKATAHDDYLVALRALAREYARIRRERMDLYMKGYEGAIQALSQFTADAMRDRLIESGQ